MSNLAYAPTGETILYANPYNLDARGFYFSTADEFQTKAGKLRDRFGNEVEEFEIEFIDGEDGQLFNVCGIGQTNLETWFDRVESLESYEKAALFYLTDVNGYSLEEGLDTLNDVCLHQGELLDAATELFDECYAHEIPENLRVYIDYESFAHDCEVGGDMTEFDFDGSTWTVTNAAGV